MQHFEALDVNDQQHVMPIVIDEDTTIQATVTVLSGEEDVSASSLSFEGATIAIEAIANKLTSVFRQLGPGKAAVEFGIQLSVKEGKLTGLLVGASGEASLKISLEWSDFRNVERNLT